MVLGFWEKSIRQLTEKLPLVHAVLESLVAVDEDDRYLIIELATQFVIGIYIDFLPRKAAASRQFTQALFNDFAKMAAFAGVDHDGASVRHAGILALEKVRC